MIVYRTITSNEFLELIGRENMKSHPSLCGRNTFKYDDEKEYIHFFKFLVHSLYFMKIMENQLILKLDIPEILLGDLEYGFYSSVDTFYDDALYGYCMPLPEYVMDKENYQKEFIIDVTSNGCFQNPLRLKEHLINYDLHFWVEKQHKKKMEQQLWKEDSIYYEYIKSLAKIYEYDMDKVAAYLKTINLDEELKKQAEEIKKNKTTTKRYIPRSHDHNW